MIVLILKLVHMYLEDYKLVLICSTHSHHHGWNLGWAYVMNRFIERGKKKKKSYDE